MSLSRRLALGLIASLLLIAAVAAITLRRIDALVSHESRVIRTYEVLFSLNGLMGAVADLEAGGRGYALTGNRRFIAQFEAARGELLRTLRQLRLLVGADTQLERVVTDKISFTSNVLRARKERGAATAQALTGSLRGKLLTDRIRELVARREAGERRELEALRSEARASVSLTTEQVFTVFLGALVLLSLGWVVIARSITRPIRQLSAFAENFGKGANPAPLRMRGEDEISRLASTIREMAERRRRIEQDLRVLSEAGTWLGTSLDYQGVLRHAVQMAIPQFAGGTAIDILDRERGELRREAAGHSDPEIARQAFEMGIRAPVSIDGNNPLARVFRSGKSVIFEDLRKEGYGVIARSPEHLELLRKNQPKSAICVLLRARGMSFGVMVFYSFDRTYGQQDLFLAEALGRRTALALDNARLYEQAQKAVRTREEVLAIVSHDLRNPLASLRMSCEMIGRLAPEGGRGETFRRVAERGLRATDFMSRMISDLLDAATIESGRLSISPATESLCSIIQESILNVLPGALEKEILIESPADTGLTVWADRQRLVQVLANLLNNAVKFSPRESHVRVDVSWQGDSARVAVRDEGPGMEPGTVAQLFQRFWRPSDVPGKGAGLGLYIAKGLVEAHGGRIWVESAPNRGSTFFFSVPTRAAARAAS